MRVPVGGNAPARRDRLLRAPTGRMESKHSRVCVRSSGGTGGQEFRGERRDERAAYAVSDIYDGMSRAVMAIAQARSFFR